jgi:D-sedoheptulose 7-phosphate isomerase
LIAAVESARAGSVKSIGLLGRGGGKLASIVDIPVVVPHSVTARIQEAHVFVTHFWSSFVENTLFFSEE